jgi:Protein of unknown function (DUF1579)
MKSFACLPALLLAAWVCTGSSAFSQEDRQEQGAVREDTPGPVHKQLSELAGVWDVTIQYKLGDKFRDGTAKCEASSILGGRFLRQEYNTRFQGNPFTVVQILGYDNARKKSIEIKVDNMHTGAIYNEGTVSDDAKVFTNEGETLEAATGKPYKLRTVYTIIDGDHFTLEWYRIDDAGKADRVVSMTHTRKKA